MERKGKRTAWRKATSIVASAVLAATAVVVPQSWNTQDAAAYELNENLPVSHQNPDGPQPQVVSNSVVVKGSPYKPGDRFTYDITSVAKAPEWEDGRQGGSLEDFVLMLTVPKVAPLTGNTQQFDGYQPSGNDFLWSDGVRRQIVSQDRREEGDSYVYTFTFDVHGHGRGADDLTLEASLPARIDPEIAEKQSLNAKIDTRVTADDIGIEWPGSTEIRYYGTSNRCVRIYEQTKTHDGKGRNGDGYGSWLLHVKSGASSANLVPAGEIEVEFSNAQGIELLPPKYNPDDNSPALVPSTNYDVSPGNVWKSSTGWEYNPETHTGTQWIADGTVVTMRQAYRDLNCTYQGTEFGASGYLVSMGIESSVAPRTSGDGAESDRTFEVIVDEPAFEVSKVADGRRSSQVAPKATLVDGTEGEEGAVYRANYTVTVENTGGAKGQSGAIVDTPAEVSGYELVGAKVGGEDVEIVDGELKLSDGETLLPGQTREFKLSVDYKRTAEAIPEDLENAGKCETRGTEPSKTGVVNTVTLDGEDESQLGDNHDCVEIPAEPAFNVQKVAKGREGADQAPSAVDLGDGKFRADYTVSVVNIGGVEGAFGRVVDQPKELEGFTIVEVTVDGAPVEATDGAYVISEGEQLAPGTPTQRGTRDFQLSVTYQRDEDATPEALDNAAKCEPVSEDREPSKTGAVNVAELEDEREDLAGDNDDCVKIPQQPEFNVKKAAAKDTAERLPNGSYKASYTVTVENTGKASGHFGPVADTPFNSTNIAVSDVLVNGKRAKRSQASEGSYIVSDGGSLDAGKTATFNVDVFYTVKPETTGSDWDKVAKCEPGEDGGFSSGAHNVATLDNEAPGREDDNSDCVVINRPPAFEVKKVANGAVATRNADGTFTANYTITVNNTSPVDGAFGEVVDTPREQPGFTITSVLIDGDEVEVEDGHYLVNEGETLAGESSRDFQVAVTYAPNGDITSEQWDNAGVCEANTQRGLVNVVRLEGETPGKEGDNSDCVIVPPTSELTIDKTVNGQDADTEDDYPAVKPGDPMVIQYVLTNNGPVTLTEVGIEDVVEQGDGEQKALQEEINAALAEQLKEKLTLEPGESRVITIQVTAPESVHKNAARPVVPPVTVDKPSTVPSTTRPPLTVPPVTLPKTTIPGTTLPGTTVPGTTVPPLTLTPEITTDRGGSTPTTDTPTPTPTPCDCTKTTVTKTLPEVTVTRTTPVATVQTITPTPEVVVTTVTGPTETATSEAPGQVVVVVDEDDKTVTRVAPTPTDSYVPKVTHTATYTLPPLSTQTVTVTDTPVTSTTKTSVINKCVANAVRSPLLYMVPLVLAGQLLGDAAAPYVAQINDRFNQISNEIQEEIRRNTPDLGFGRRGQENEQVAQLRARVDEANRQLGQLMNRPEVREYGKWAAVALGVVVAGSVLYDWCTNEAGEAFTAIGPKKTTTIDDVRVGGSSLLGRGGASTSVAPVTQTSGGSSN